VQTEGISYLPCPTYPPAPATVVNNSGGVLSSSQTQPPPAPPAGGVSPASQVAPAPPAGGVSPASQVAPAPAPVPAPAPAPPAVGVGSITFTLPTPATPVSQPAAVAPTQLVTQAPTVQTTPCNNATFQYNERTNVICVRYPQPLPASWCQLNNLDVTKVRSVEANCIGVHQKLNQLYGYISPAALYIRRDLQARNFYQGIRANQESCTATYNFATLHVSYDDNKDAGRDIYQVRDSLNKVLPNHYCAPENLKDHIQSIVGQNTVLDENSVSNVFKTSVDAASGGDGSGAASVGISVGAIVVAAFVMMMQNI